MPRKIDLEEFIRASYDLIRDYDAITQTSPDPREKARARQIIEEQWKLIETSLTEYLPLVGNDLPNDIAEIAAHFAQSSEQAQKAPPSTAPSTSQRSNTAHSTLDSLNEMSPHVNPFRVGKEIRDPANFIGRKDILQAISSAMLSLQSISLHGERRTGKTSLLLYLENPSSASMIGLPPNHIPVYFNFQGYPQTSMGRVWQAIIRKVAKQIGQRHPNGQTEPKQLMDAIIGSAQSSESFVTSFAEALSRLDTIGFKIHFLFDEFEQTANNPNLGAPFYDALRSLPIRAENVSYVIATRTGLADLQPTYNKISSPFFNIFTTLTLPPFRKDEVDELIANYFARTKLDPTLAEKLCTQSDFLYKVTGYHPFFLQTLCYHLCERLDRPDWPLGQTQQEALEAFEKDAEPHFKYYWDVSSEEEQQLLKSLAAGHRIEPSHFGRVERNLRDRCLIVPAKSGWQPFSSTFSTWVVEYQGGPPKPEQGVWPTGYILDHRYKINEQLAVTKCSEIYLAEELQPPKQTLVVKRLRPDKLQDEKICRRFEREILALRQISHECVLPVYDSKTIGPDRYFVTAFADKGTLEKCLMGNPQHKLRCIEAIEIALSVCQGLAAAHRQGIVHRDVKPGNVFLFSQRGGSVLAKVADFSVARIPQEKSFTEIDSFIGTYPYASPEQFDSPAVDHRSDLYSWAIVLFEMLTGESPTDSLKDPETFCPTSDEFPTSFFVERSISPRLIEVLQKNLRLDPKLRYQSAIELQKVLESIKSQVLADIQHHLSAGETLIRSSRWQIANTEFGQGLKLCAWYGEPDELRDPIKGLERRLRLGYTYTQGMISLSDGQWQAAIEALESLQALDPSYMGIDIAAQLRLAQLERQREQKHQLLIQHRKHKNWSEVYRLATDLIADYEGSSEAESAVEIRKLSLYARGQNLLEEGELEKAYDQFHRLYEMDPAYEDIAELCTTVAFKNAMREDLPLGDEHQIKWLEEVVKIAPDHEGGRTQQLLDRIRHRRAGKLLEEEKWHAAVCQLESISTSYDERTRVYRALVDIYYQLLRDGDYSRTEKANLDVEAEARYRMGAELWGKGDIQGAIEQFTAIQPQTQEFPSAQSALAKIYEKLGDQEFGRLHFIKAIRQWYTSSKILDNVKKYPGNA